MVVTAFFCENGKLWEIKCILIEHLFITFQHNSVLMFTNFAENALR
jgi:hypothetical protein